MPLVIKGTGSALPAKVVTNDEFSKIVDTSDEWIRERTGIEKRHIATGETVVSLASSAAIKALENAKKDADLIDLIIVASCSAEQALPCVACQVQKHIGAAKAVAFDLNAACSGFLFAMNLADVYISSGVYSNALIIGAEVLSNIIDWTDRTTCVLFGDGAGAVYFEKDESAGRRPFKFIQRSDGFKGEALICGQRDPANAFFRGNTISKYVTMDGREIFKFATRKVPETILELLGSEGLNEDDIDLFLLHQANLRIIECICRKLNADISKFPSNVQNVGNTSSASIPILIDETRRSGQLKEGMKIILSGFGAGLTYGACLLEL